MQPDSNVPRGFIMKTITAEDKLRKYVVYIPPVYNPATPIPAIVFLHGMGQCGTDGLRHVSTALGSAVMQNIDSWPFIVIAPQKEVAEMEWSDIPEMALALGSLAQTRQDYNIDSSRIYLTGLSQGGHGTWAIGAQFAGLFAAIAPVCGYSDQKAALKLAEAGVPVWAFHGDADTTVVPKRSYEMQKWIEEAGGSCKLTIYPGVGHNSWDKAYREEKLNEWFLSNIKAQTSNI